MKRSQRLQVVEKLAKQREDQAAMALAQVRQQLQLENQRYEELVQYRTEYMGYLDQQGNTGISIEQWRRTQGFIDQLGDLMARQTNTIAQWQQRELQILQKWQLAYQRRKNIAQYIDNISIEEMMIADKKEQRAIDELVSQKLSQLPN